MDVEGRSGDWASWELAVVRDDLSRTRLRSVPEPEVRSGEALVRVNRVGLTANNVTYAVLGESFRYWEFFPTDPGWGVVPLWGFADVLDSAVDGLQVGTRVYGYLPSASHLLVRPGRVDARGFREASEHRVPLPSPYNAYASTIGDPAYDADLEDLLVLYRPLFWTSFMLADWLLDNDLKGADAVVLSSASSKTAYGAAFQLHGRGGAVVGLTSPGNVAFVESLGCYDQVLPYDEIDRLPASTPTLYADVAGDPDLTRALRTHLGAAVVHEVVVGVTHQEAGAAGTLEETGEEMFFAPNQMRKRIGDWGRDELDRRFADAWRHFATVVSDWVDIVLHDGPKALEQVWLDTYAGRSDPRQGHVIAL
jgi:NADPH:quinone reductase-like Zn-dependent oxidoreductase